jgi:hypothetical protein
VDLRIMSVEIGEDRRARRLEAERERVLQVPTEGGCDR